MQGIFVLLEKYDYFCYNMSKKKGMACMHKRVQENQYRLKQIQLEIERATEKKEIEAIQEKLKLIEKEVNALQQAALKNHYFEKMKAVRTLDEAYLLYEEIQGLKRNTDKRKNELEGKKEKVEQKDIKNGKIIHKIDELDEKKKQFSQTVEKMMKTTEEIQKQVSKEIEVNETVEVVKEKKSVLLDALMLIYIAKSNIDNKIKIPLALVLMNEISKKLQGEEKEIIHVEYRYEDVEKTIKEAMDSIDDLESDMKIALKDVDAMIGDYEKEFEEFRGLKEYNEILGMLTTAKDALEKEYGNVQDLQQDLDKSLEENNQKVLKIQS